MFMYLKVILEDSATDNGTIDKWVSDQVTHLTVEGGKIDKDDDTQAFRGGGGDP